MKALDPEAWTYLKDIGTKKWALLHDSHHRRWGNMTTNIAESLNNVLRDARLLPIKALINHTFEKAVNQFRKNCAASMACTSPLAPRVWKEFNKRDRYAQQHEITHFDYTSAVYRVVSRLQADDSGGNDYTVYFFKGECTCGKWQMVRFPCSHAIAVCRHRGVNPQSVVDDVYTLENYQRQYRRGFQPMQHVDYWADPGWSIVADQSRLSTARGRRASRRMTMEMDRRLPDEPIRRRCGYCNQEGHNRTTCPYTQHSHD